MGVIGRRSRARAADMDRGKVSWVDFSRQGVVFTVIFGEVVSVMA